MRHAYPVGRRRCPAMDTVGSPVAAGGNGASMSAGHDGSLALYTRIALYPIGSPLPLGLLALMCAGVLLSLQQVEALPLDQARQIALILVGFVVPLELIAAILSFLARDTVAGTALGLFTGAWLATALVMLTSSPGETSSALGAFLFA